MSKETRDLFLREIWNYGRDHDGKFPNYFRCSRETRYRLIEEAEPFEVSSDESLVFKFMGVPVYPDSECGEDEVQTR